MMQPVPQKMRVGCHRAIGNEMEAQDCTGRQHDIPVLQQHMEQSLAILFDCSVALLLLERGNRLLTRGNEVGQRDQGFMAQ